MAELPLLTREYFDDSDALQTAVVGFESPFAINLTAGCHQGSPLLVSYRDGVLRLLCASCGFEAFRIAVASSASSAQEEGQGGS